MQPFSADKLVTIFKVKNPDRHADIDKMYALFRQYRQSQSPTDPVLVLLKRIEAALLKHSRITLRDVQLMNVLMLGVVAVGRGELAEIKTGEGKSNVIKVLAALFCLRNPETVVDIVTTGDTLAKKDAEDPKTKAFFKELGISVDHVIDIETRRQENEELENDEKNPLLSRVLYGTPSAFACCHLYSHNFDTMKFYQKRAEKLESTHLIVDEVDNMLVDTKNNATLLSSVQRQSSDLLLIQKAIFSSMARLIGTITASAGTNASSEGNLSQEHICGLIDGVCKRFRENLQLSNKDQSVFDACHNSWVQSCYKACLVLKENKDFVIKNKKIQIVDHSNTGEISQNSRWQAGLHRFLEFKYGLPVGDDTLISNSMSNFKYFRMYGSRLSGLTGTMGGEVTKKFIRDTYRVSCYRSPSYRTSQLNLDPPTITWDKPFLKVVEDATNKLQAGRIVLTINKDIDSCEELIEYVKAELRPKLPGLKVIEYFDSTEELIADKLKNLGPNTLIVASNLAGRGTDIEVSEAIEANGGLHVIITFLPENDRVLAQAEGRAGRKGQKGTAKLIYQLPDDLKGEASQEDLESQAKEINDVLVQQQKKDEEERMQNGTFEVQYHTAMDSFQEQYWAVLKEYPQFHEHKSSSSQIADDFAEIRNKIESAYQIEKDAILSHESKEKEHLNLIDKVRKKFKEHWDPILKKCATAAANKQFYSVIDIECINSNERQKLEAYQKQILDQAQADPHNLQIALTLCIIKFKLAIALKGDVALQNCEDQVLSLIRTLSGKKAIAEQMIQKSVQEAKEILKAVDFDTHRNELESLEPKSPHTDILVDTDTVNADMPTGASNEPGQSDQNDNSPGYLQAAKNNLQAGTAFITKKMSSLTTTATDLTKKMLEGKMSELYQDALGTSSEPHEYSQEISLDDQLWGDCLKMLDLMKQVKEAKEKGSECKAELNCSVSPQNTIQVTVSQTGYAGYWIGGVMAFGGTIVMLRWKLHGLGMDLIMGGVNTALQNLQMNLEGTYNLQKMWLNALETGLSIAAHADLDPYLETYEKTIADEIKGIIEKQGSEGDLTIVKDKKAWLEQIGHIRKWKQSFDTANGVHNSIIQVIQNRGQGSMQILKAMTEPKPTQQAVAATQVQAAPAAPTTAPTAPTTAPAAPTTAADVEKAFKQQAEESKLAQKMQEIDPVRTARLKRVIKDQHASKWAQTILQEIQGALKTCKPLFLLQLFQTSKKDAIRDFLEVYRFNLKRAVRSVPTREECKIWAKPDSYYEGIKDFTQSEEVLRVSEYTLRQIKAWQKEPGEPVPPRSFTGIGEAKAKLAELNKQIEAAQKEQADIANQQSISNEDQSRLEYLANRIEIKMKIKELVEFVHNEYFKTVFEKFFKIYVEKSLLASMSSPLNFTIEVYKRELSRPLEVGDESLSDELLNPFCRSTFEKVRAMLANVTQRWNEFEQTFIISASELLANDIEYQILRRISENKT